MISWINWRTNSAHLVESRHGYTSSVVNMAFYTESDRLQKIFHPVIPPHGIIYSLDLKNATNKSRFTWSLVWRHSLHHITEVILCSFKKKSILCKNKLESFTLKRDKDEGYKTKRHLFTRNNLDRSNIYGYIFAPSG